MSVAVQIILAVFTVWVFTKIRNKRKARNDVK